MITRRRCAALAATALGALGLSGCQFNLQGLPSPGGGPPGDSYRLTAVFADVLNLPQRAQVKLDGVVVGQVTTISLRNFTGQVQMAIARSITLPKGTTAEIRFTTPLGEDYVSLNRPTGATGGASLGDGAVIPETSTDSAPTIEDTFALLSAVLNGGGLDQLRTIIVETNTAIGGHEGQARDLLTQLNTVVTALSTHTGDIDRALDALNSLSAELNGQSGVIANGLQKIAPALGVLASEADDLNTLLTHLGKLGVVGGQVITQSRDAFLADLHSLGPVLDSLVSIRGSLGSFLDSLHTFEGAAANAAPGDYLNLVVDATATLGDVTPKAMSAPGP
ncbi:MAG: MCE family protein, partial [Candidatus Dormibacteria bacterium]